MWNWGGDKKEPWISLRKTSWGMKESKLNEQAKRQESSVF